MKFLTIAIEESGEGLALRLVDDDDAYTPTVAESAHARALAHALTCLLKECGALAVTDPPERVQ